MWKDVELRGFEGVYEINENGVVRSKDRKITKSDGVVYHRKSKILSWNPNSDGYASVHLSKGGKSIRVAVHLLVARAFVPNPNNYEEVNHIDCDRMNPYYKNLQWTTHAENIKHSHKLGHYAKPQYVGAGNPKAKAVRINELDKDFQTISECAEYLIAEGYTSGSKQNALSEIIKVYKKLKKSYLGFTYSLI